MVRKELVIFLVVGSLTVLVDYMAYRGMVFLDLISIDWSKGIGFVMGTIFAYFANRFWTFGHQEHRPHSVWRFVLLYTTTLILNVMSNAIVLKLMEELTAVVTIAFLFATAISATLNFLGMKYFVFGSHFVKSPRDDQSLDRL